MDKRSDIIDTSVALKWYWVYDAVCLALAKEHRSCGSLQIANPILR